MPRRAGWKAKRSPKRNKNGRNTYYEHRKLKAVPVPRDCWGEERLVDQEPVYVEAHEPTELEHWMGIVEHQESIERMYTPGEVA